MRSLITAVFAGTILTTIAPWAGAAHGGVTELNLVRHSPRGGATSDSGEDQQLIVKLRTAADQQAQALRIDALAARRGLGVDAQRSITSRMHVLKVHATVSGETVDELLAHLRADPEVEYAVVDQRRYIQAVTPDDPLYSEQWYLHAATAATPAAMDATDAWSTTSGSSNAVIADIDTGVRPDHPDLAGKLVPGYCFISNSFVANNSTCPGPDDSDPGDWITSTDISSHPAECGGESTAYSSWHGTRVAGILGAASNNGTGIAGVTWDPQIMPVRAIGKCGGRDSDIITAMLWAAGIRVTANGQSLINPNPARVINLSLGSSGVCPASYQDAINQILAKGAVVVASAGNESGAVAAPANCSGVIAVGGLREDGIKVGYSSFGSQVAISAPAGNCVNVGAQQPCLYTITTTTNLGIESPSANDYTGEYYCYPDSTGGSSPGSYVNCSIAPNQYRTYNVGTSFSAPLVAGLASLMAAVNGNLSPSQIAARIKTAATAFPQSSLDTSPQPPACPSTSSGGQCICTNDGHTCGAGMANASASVDQALRPIAAVSLPAPSFTAGQSVELNGGGSAAADGSVITTYAWSNVGNLALAIADPDLASASVTSPSCGIGTVRLTVTDDAGRQDTADVVITPNSASTTAPSTASPTSPASPTPTVMMAVCPATANLLAGAAGQSFVAYVANATNTAVSWQVNGIAGGNATVGTVSASGLYTPPATVSTSTIVNVTAVSAADASTSASAQVTITPTSSPTPSKSGGGGGGAWDWLSLMVVVLLAACTRMRVLRHEQRGQNAPSTVSRRPNPTFQPQRLP
jgi:serine protease